MMLLNWGNETFARKKEKTSSTFSSTEDVTKLVNEKNLQANNQAQGAHQELHNSTLSYEYSPLLFLFTCNLYALSMS